MAESILFDAVKRVVEVLGTEAVKELRNIFCVKDDLKELGDTLSSIKAELHDAEKRQATELGVRSWLERLEDVVYDADYLFDEVSYEALRNKLDKKEWNNCLPLILEDLAFKFKVAQRIKAIRRTLRLIAADRDQFGFQTISHEEEKAPLPRSEDRETHSRAREANVIGRDSDKMHILKLLVGTKSTESTEAELSVIPIVGAGGIGKTTLAQLVYNDASVQQHFELKIWVCVSEDFSLRSLLKKIIQSASPSKTLGNLLEELRRELEDILNGKKYLLVLDDVWNEDAMEWKNLETLLSSGKKGSKIIITTRIGNMATITGAKEFYELKELNDDQSWNLFKSMAFARGEEPNDPSKVTIGREIASRCYGVPLVIMSIGSLLLQSPEIDWFSFCRDELLSIPDDSYRDKVLKTLRLSYDHLSSDMKRCFAYCSLIPKDYEIDKEMLTDHWVAQGFISIPNMSSQQSIEKVACQYFDGLSARGFLEYDRGYHDQFKMHDLMHDLAVYVAGKKYATLRKGNTDVEERRVDKRTRYVSLLDFDNLNLVSSNSSWEIPSSLVEAKMIQSILIPTESNFIMTGRRFDPLFYEAIVSKFKYLHSLDLHNSGIETVPDAIGKLKHLRTLDLSRNAQLEVLPDSIRELLNLQTLNLTSCFRLKELPRGVSQLVNLRNLRLDYCHQLSHLPRGLGRLTKLQTLSRLVLSKDSNNAELTDLKNLNNLRGRLEIRNLGHGMDTEIANFGEKHYLESLSLFWVLDADVSELRVDHKRTFTGIQPIPNLKDLLLSGYRDVVLPSWVSCRNLVTLKLENMPNLEYITSSWDSSTTLIMPFLRFLTLTRLPNLKGWWRDILVLPEPRIFPHLGTSLCIQHCPQLHCMPLFPFLGWEQELKNTSWKPFLQTLEHVIAGAESRPIYKVHRLTLSSNEDLEYFPDCMRILTNLGYLCIRSFPKLRSLSPCIHHFVSLFELRIEYCEQLDIYDENMWRALGSHLTHLTIRGLPQLVDLPEGLQHVTTLKSFGIGFCYNMTSIPNWICNLHSLTWFEVMECPKLTYLPEGISAEITSHDEENIFHFPYLMERFGIPIGADGYNCIPIPSLRLHPKSSNIGDPSQSSSTSSPGVKWDFRHRFCVPELTTP